MLLRSPASSENPGWQCRFCFIFYGLGFFVWVFFFFTVDSSSWQSGAQRIQRGLREPCERGRGALGIGPPFSSSPMSVQPPAPGLWWSTSSGWRSLGLLSCCCGTSQATCGCMQRSGGILDQWGWEISRTRGWICLRDKGCEWVWEIGGGEGWACRGHEGIVPSPISGHPSVGRRRFAVPVCCCSDQSRWQLPVRAWASGF